MRGDLVRGRVRGHHGGMADPRAGTLAQPSDLVDVAHLVTAYYTLEPDPDDVDQRVVFGTSGHRGCSLRRRSTRSTSRPRRRRSASTAASRGTTDRSSSAGHPRLVGAGVGDGDRGAGRQRRRRPGRRGRPLHPDPGGLPRDPGAPTAGARPGTGLADGIVVTPSHNPPRDGGFKYNPPHGGPADTDATSVIADRANELIAGQPRGRPPDHVRPRPRRGARRTTSWRPTSTTCRTSSTSTRSARRHPDRRRPAGRRERRLLGRHRRAARARPHGRQPAGRPDLALHDARLGRQDPDGLLVAERDGVADRHARTSSTSRPATTPTPTGTASSRPTPA